MSLDFFSFPFCGRGSFFGLFACARFRCFVCSFFCGGYARCRCCLSIHTAERGNRENSWVSRDARQTAAMKSLMLLRFPSNITCFSPVPLYSVLPRNKAPYAAAAVSSLTSACLLWRVLNLYRIAEYRALLSTVISPGLVDRSDLTALHCVIVALRGIENPIPRFLPLSLRSPSLSLPFSLASMVSLSRVPNARTLDEPRAKFYNILLERSD